MGVAKRRRSVYIIYAMIQEHIEQIESKVRGAANVPSETQAEILGLLESLKAEIATLGQTPPPETPETQIQPESGPIHDLTRSVEGFETSHPELVANVNRLAVILSNMGI
jgi:hypothetical protein